MGSNVAAQNEFGRFYTTPRQRQQLEDLRNQRPQDEIVVEVAAETLQETTNEQNRLSNIDSITVNGLVYRSDGKNTAWINSNNVIQGSIVNQFTTVNENNVHPDNVEITLPDNQSHVHLKVGQQFDIYSEQIYDVVQDPISPIPNVDPRESTQRR